MNRQRYSFQIAKDNAVAEIGICTETKEPERTTTTEIIISRDKIGGVIFRLTLKEARQLQNFLNNYLPR